jgi:hypothetical protein
MLMFTFHIAFALGLIALTLGLFLKKCCKCGGGCKTQQCDTNGQGKCSCKCGSWCAMIVIILAALSLVCTMHAGYSHWKAGDFHMPAAMATGETIQMNVE